MTSYLWHADGGSERLSDAGSFSLEKILPFIRRLNRPGNSLFLSLPHFSLDFHGLDDGSIEMENMDVAGDNFAIFTLTEAEQVARLAFEHIGSESFYHEMSALPLRWL